MGGHCRTELEDNIRMDRRTLAPSTLALVAQVARLAEEQGLPVANARQARAIFGLPVVPPAKLELKKGVLTPVTLGVARLAVRR
jgi:hypothetical protein